LFPTHAGVGNKDSPFETFQTARHRWERTNLSSTLTRNDWNVSQTARELDMSCANLNALIRTRPGPFIRPLRNTRVITIYYSGTPT